MEGKEEASIAPEALVHSWASVQASSEHAQEFQLRLPLAYRV